MIESSIVSELDSVIAKQPVDEVLVALPMDKYGGLVETIVRHCEEQGIVVRVRTDMFNLRIGRWQVDEVNGLSMVTVQTGPTDGWQLIVKRVIDISVSATMLLLLLPLFLAVALLIKLSSRGPVLFKQERIGLNKHRFRLLKFRTMTDGAEKTQTSLEILNEANGPVFKIKDDPRITRIGKFLRRSSIDELPQLFNVLRGDMSLVGPRPLPLRDFERVNSLWHKRRVSVKPGMTCLWQVNGRSNINFDYWVKMDLEYIDNWSLGLDLKILLKTIPAVLKGSGAY
jgi:exopolysaccharide biosynthesis polyprenyl glycosylphosphotransferase